MNDQAPVRIIGIGSPAGDDAIAWQVIEVLQHELRDDANVSCIALDRPATMLLHVMHGARCVVIIDAVVSGAPPGTVHRFSLQDIGGHGAHLLSSHGFGAAQALALGRELDMLPPRLTVIGIELFHAHPGTALSAAARRALPEAVAAAVDEARLCSGLDSAKRIQALDSSAPSAKY